MTAQQESVQATDEHLKTKGKLEEMENELEEERKKADDGKKTSEADYRDMHEAMGQLVEEANKKTMELEARLKEAEALVAVREKELAEAKVHPSPFYQALNVPGERSMLI